MKTPSGGVSETAGKPSEVSRERETLRTWSLGRFLPMDTLAGIAFLQFLVITLQCLQQIPRESSGLGRVLLLLVLVALGVLEATFFLPVSSVMKKKD